MSAHFFVPPDAVEGETAALDVPETHHLTTVLRARPGTEVTVADGSGRVWQGRYDGVHDGHAVIALGASRHEPAPQPSITVVHALPKQRKLDEVIQRLTELGVDRIVPVHSARSQVELNPVKAAKAEARWKAVAQAAAKQSRRSRLPEIAPVSTWGAAFSAADAGVVCWEESQVGMQTALSSVGIPATVVVGIGPEGGLTPEEVHGVPLREASLGPTVLRTETAAVVAVAAVRYHFGLMERPA